MKYLETLRGKHITVLGLGITGQGIVRFLLSHGITPKIVDSRPVPPGADWLNHNAPDCEAVFGSLADAALAHTDMIIISPGIPLFDASVAQAISQGVEVIGDIELFARLNDKPVVAVTGSNGKSTVVTLTAEVLQAAGMRVGLGGNIGTSVLSLLESEYDVYVLELSSFQLETTSSLQCTSAMILNITEDHMDRYPDFAAYCEAKHRIYCNVQNIVFNGEDVKTFAKAKSGVSVALTGGDYHVCEKDGDMFFAHHNQALLPVKDLILPGKHNQFNALAVLALLAPFKLPIAAFTKAFGAFAGLPHRCQLVADVNGVRYFNDSKATNVGATVAAIESLCAVEQRNIILLVGGDAKGADISSLKQPIQQHCKALFCFGKDGEKFLPLHRNSHVVSDLSAAVKAATSISTVGDIVLLAPACASLDMYPNYMARGDEFIRLVEDLL
ncbi:UDP-N-acetylmuramoyl-L-alanine--D-glutamate ligase [Pseudoalteromonas sp. T1lg65]|uniref:UDP-N-acetylmuramoyl-L-alanine--D-glutamate ligase n=1 Tax=Pseudoalteromonas sp. T1lg65 TaxID=2077101 RepID=UPI003F7A5828